MNLDPRRLIATPSPVDGRAGKLVAIMLISFLFSSFAVGQEWQFAFDANGNLVSQASGSLVVPQILSQPQMQIVPPGASASFSVLVADTRGLTYQWQFNGADIAGATSDTLLVTNVGAVHAGDYSVVLANGMGSVTSLPAALLLDSDRDGLPDSWEVANFGSLSPFPTGDADGDGISNGDEFLDGTDPSDPASVLFRLNVVSNGGVVTVVPSKLKFTNGEIVTLTATALHPDIFRGWTGDIRSTNNPLTVVMASNMTMFAHLGSYDITWATSASGDWNVASNWDPPFVPTTNDNVIISRNVTVTLNTDAVVGSLTFGASGAVPSLTGSGTLWLNRDSTWTAGTMLGSGRTVIKPGATLIIDPPNTVFLTTRTLDNGGTVVWTGVGNITFNNAVITNRPGALFHVQSAGGDFNNAVSSAARFDNAGTFRKSVSTASINAVNGVAFNNYGRVEVQAGVLGFGGGGVNVGTFETEAGAGLNLYGGTFTSPAGSSITGGANFTVSGATANLAGLVNLTGTHTFSSGTANLTGNYLCTNNTLTISGGTVNLNGTGVIAPTVFNLSVGTLSGANLVTVGSTMNWSGGTMSGSGRTVIPVGSVLNVTPANAVSLTTRTLDNGGTVLWTGAGNITFNNAVITNRPGALFHAQSAGGDFNNAVSSSARFDNAGMFRKSVSAATMNAVNGVAFNNYSIVDIQTGGFGLGGGGINTGTYEMAAGTGLNLYGGTFTSTAGAILAGPANFTVSGATASLAGLVNLTGTHTFSSGTANLTGNYFCTNNTLTISGGTVNFNGTGAVAPAVLNLSVGTLSGANLVIVGSVMNWSGGTMTGNGRTLIPAGSVLNVTPPNAVNLTTRTLDNAGTVLWTGVGNITFNNAVITNRPGAWFHAQSAGGDFNNAVSSAARFDNAGTFRKSVSTASMNAVNGVAFNNYSLVEIQTGSLGLGGGGVNVGTFEMGAGTGLNLYGGTFTSAVATSITGGANFTVSGATANLAGLVNLTGTHTFSSGTANLTGNYLCTNNTLTISGGTVNFNGTGVVAPAVLNLSVGTLSGANLVTVGSVMNWSGGTMTGNGRTVIPVGSVLNVTPANAVSLTTRTLENGGTVLWTGVGNITFNNAVITNRPGALFHAQSAGGDFNNAVSSVARFDNSGTFRKSVNTGLMTVASGVNFNNYNTLEIRSGILGVNGSYISTSNSTFNCTLGGTNVGTGYGRLQVANTVALNGTLGIELLSGFVPETNATFTVLTAGVRSGTFTRFLYPSNAITMQMSNTANSVLVRVTDILVHSQPVLLPPERAGTDIRLIWTSVSNMTYRLEYKADLSLTNWTILPGDVTGVSNTAVKLDALTPSNRFYRVRTIP